MLRNTDTEIKKLYDKLYVRDAPSISSRYKIMGQAWQVVTKFF